MRVAIAIIALSGFGLLNVAAASAQPSDGGMGSRSRAEVRISVSVLPRFQAKTVSKVEDANEDAEGIALLAINAPKLRFSVVRPDPGEAQTPDSSGTPRDSLLIVVPD